MDTEKFEWKWQASEDGGSEIEENEKGTPGNQNQIVWKWK
jgi:hypothetical protein